MFVFLHKTVMLQVDEYLTTNINILQFIYSGHIIVSVFPAYGDEIQPWGMKFKSREPLWQVNKKGSFKYD